jgi:lysophospholipase L1-like esterase
MQNLIEKYPEARIVVMTPLHRAGELNVNANGKTLADYVGIIREVAEYYSLPVLDLFRISGMQPEINVIKKTYVPDGLHPNDKGHERMADIIGAYLSSM